MAKQSPQTPTFPDLFWAPSLNLNFKIVFKRNYYLLLDDPDSPPVGLSQEDILFILDVFVLSNDW